VANINPGAVNDAAQWLRECPFGEWIEWGDVPEDIFNEVFELIDGRFLGWVYYFNDDDTAFKKSLPFEVTTAAISSLKRINRERFETEMFKLGDSV